MYVWHATVPCSMVEIINEKNSYASTNVREHYARCSTAVRHYLIIRNIIIIIIIITTGNVNEPVCDQNYHITFEFDDFIWLTIGRAQPRSAVLLRK